MRNESGSLVRVNVRLADDFCAMPDFTKPLLILTVFSVISALIQVDLHSLLHKTGLHIPGISGLIWMPLMVMGKMKWPKGASASYVALVLSATNVLAMPATGMGMGWGGLAVIFLRYGVSGIILDVFWPFTMKCLPRSPAYLFMSVGITALSHVGKAAFVLLSCGLSRASLPADTLPLIVLHLVFGACAGAIAAYMAAGGLGQGVSFLKSAGLSRIYTFKR